MIIIHKVKHKALRSRRNRLDHTPHRIAEV